MVADERPEVEGPHSMVDQERRGAIEQRLHRESGEFAVDDPDARNLSGKRRQSPGSGSLTL